MKCSSDPPVTQGMEQDIVGITTLIPVELKKQTMPRMELVRILRTKRNSMSLHTYIYRTVHLDYAANNITLKRTFHVILIPIPYNITYWRAKNPKFFPYNPQNFPP